ncbi:MAG: hypothetical protein L6V93_14440 [Clostridiales bacterium]|nr:MAG: hypothetical protein L6V93_14440 [Clostridiales bacterium]
MKCARQKYVVAMTGMGDSNENMQKFADALLKIDKTLKSHNNGEIFDISTKV